MSRFHGRAAAVVVLLGCSCRALLGIDDPAVGIDAPVADASLADAAPAQVCLGSAAWLQVCLTPPAVDRAFPKQMVVTGVGPSGPGSGSGSDGTDCDFTLATATGAMCVISGVHVTFDNVFVTDPSGVRPLVVVATDSIEISGGFDAGSKRGVHFGPGEATGACLLDVATSGSAGGGGGTGGSYGNFGGSGGSGLGGAGAAPSATVVDGGIQAGCPGGGGGAGTGASPQNGGTSGGVVYLIAPTIHITGALDVSGMGGGGSVEVAGGGGGGTGGFVGLDALDELILDGTVSANGGGGGGGAGFDASGSPANGARGGDGNPVVGIGGKAGGLTGGAGGDGTRGTTTAALAGGNARSALIGSAGSGSGSGSGSVIASGGGGGGGGGLGIVWLVGSTAPTGSGAIEAVVVQRP